MEEMVVLVDVHGNEIGVEEKIEAHKKGLLHRAFSIFVFNKKGEILLQKRAAVKYHAAGLWSNTCCGHPRPGERLEDAAHRRLKEEFGFDCLLNEVTSFFYRAVLGSGLIEHEHDHIFKGTIFREGVCDGAVFPDPDEIESYRWCGWGELLRGIEEQPEIYTPWLRKIVQENLL